MARLTPELRTTPKKFAQQMRRTNLLTRMEGHHIDSGGSNVEALVEGEVESSVFFSNLTKTSLLPQLTKSSPKIITPHQRSSPTICQSCSKRMQQNSISSHECSRIFVNCSLTICNHQYYPMFSNKCIRKAKFIKRAICTNLGHLASSLPIERDEEPYLIFVTGATGIPV